MCIRDRYRGILPPIVMEAPKRALKFASNEFYQPLFANGTTKVLGASGAITAGICTGITEGLFVIPFELVKIRLQAKENFGMYNNTIDAIVKIYKSEGILAFYKGLESTLWRQSLWNGGYFSLMFFLKKWFPAAKSEIGTVLRDFGIGAIAGTFGTILNTPSDVVKSRIQNQDALLKLGEAKKYSWTLPSLKLIAKEEGVSALYKGFVPKVLRLGPGGGIMLMVFSFVTTKFREMNARAEQLNK
eukprot:TRINITY_DN6399_c0_g1_i1.p1 TRINITY_DN6399_c0_g1~~TRINITY_DN6399_c0_g1_i1.p1  ORF type:complete len:244 (+),score=52.61 TRINITY_DN6399_c0_g1_i1:33-764(+)